MFKRFLQMETNDNRFGRILIFKQRHGDAYYFARTYQETINALQTIFETWLKNNYHWLVAEQKYRPGPMGSRKMNSNLALIEAYEKARSHDINGLIDFIDLLRDRFEEDNFVFEWAKEPSPEKEFEIDAEESNNAS